MDIVMRSRCSLQRSARRTKFDAVDVVVEVVEELVHARRVAAELVAVRLDGRAESLHEPRANSGGGGGGEADGDSPAQQHARQHRSL